MLFRNLLLIAGALAILVGVSIAGYVLLSAKPPVHVGPGAGGPSILVAARDLPSGAVLQDTDLSWKALEGGVAPPESLTRPQVSATQFVGAITRRHLAAGQIVTRDAVFDGNDRKLLAAVLSPGYRAVTIDVDAAQGGAGLILPDDRVDVILVSQTSGPANPARSSRATTLLRDVRVVAVDRAVQRQNASAAPSEPKLDSNTAAPKTIALEVTDRDAERLLLATQTGKVQLSLRSMARGPKSSESSADTFGTSDDRLRAAPASRRSRRSRTKAASTNFAGAGSAIGAPILILRGSKAAAP